MVDMAGDMEEGLEVEDEMGAAAKDGSPPGKALSQYHAELVDTCII